MAEQLDLPTLQELKRQYPGYAVVAYINTTSELKTACDVCVTSSSALKICSALENDKILFIPDPNLGGYVAKQLPEKQFAFYHGGCPRHIVCSAADVAKARAAHRGGAGRHHGAAAHLSAGNLRRGHPRGVPGRCVLAHLQVARAVPQ